MDFSTHLIKTNLSPIARHVMMSVEMAKENTYHFSFVEKQTNKNSPPRRIAKSNKWWLVTLTSTEIALEIINSVVKSHVGKYKIHIS